MDIQETRRNECDQGQVTRRDLTVSQPVEGAAAACCQNGSAASLRASAGRLNDWQFVHDCSLVVMIGRVGEISVNGLNHFRHFTRTLLVVIAFL